MFCEFIFLLSVIMTGIVDSYYLGDVTLGNRRLRSIADNNVEIDLKMMYRDDWGARKPENTTKLKTPVPFVVIHHTYIPKACYMQAECIKAMKSMQNFHIDDRGWWDIGYNFCVGSNGVVYEGRGWKTLGAHSLHFNDVSLGICLIGNWNETLPPEIQIKVTQELIEFGLSQGMIKDNYKLIGHRQVRNTECPGEELYRAIQTWPHYSKLPNAVTDLLGMEEISESSKCAIRNETRISSSS